MFLRKYPNTAIVVGGTGAGAIGFSIWYKAAKETERMEIEHIRKELSKEKHYIRKEQDYAKEIAKIKLNMESDIARIKLKHELKLESELVKTEKKLLGISIEQLMKCLDQSDDTEKCNADFKMLQSLIKSNIRA